MSIRFEKAIYNRIENKGDRQLIIVGDDYLTDFIFQQSVKMGLSPEKKNVFLCNDNAISFDRSRYFFLVAVINGHKRYYDFLISKQLQHDIDFVLMGVNGYCRKINVVDPLIGYDRVRVNEGNIPYDVIGGNGVKIGIYGSSTSDLYMCGVEGWPLALSRFLEKEGIDSQIYVGAVPGHTSGQEALKLLRDISEYAFDVVISYSGINDTESGTGYSRYPFISMYQKKSWDLIIEKIGHIPDSLDMRNITQLYWGKKSSKTNACNWLDNQKRMRGICEQFGVRFISILEPMIGMYNREIDVALQTFLDGLSIGSDLMNSQRKFVEEVRENGEEFLDLSDVFIDKCGVYEDYIHYTEEGADVVGERIGCYLKEGVIFGSNFLFHKEI